MEITNNAATEWSGLLFSTPRDLPDPGIEPQYLVSPVMAGGFFTICATWVLFKSLTVSKKKV